MGGGPDYYQILGLTDLRSDRLIPPGHLRQAYKQALLFYHPDKRNINAQHIQHGTYISSIDQVAAAYRILADPMSRA